MAESIRGLFLEIDLNAIAHNYNYIQNQLEPGARMSAAVKADAYGLGVVQVAPLLYDLGCRDFSWPALVRVSP